MHLAEETAVKETTSALPGATRICDIFSDHLLKHLSLDEGDSEAAVVSIRLDSSPTADHISMQLAQASTMNPEFAELTFKGVGGIIIFARSWRPAERPRGIVVIAPGFNSHSGQYGGVAEELVAAGLSVYAIDHRGRGRSPDTGAALKTDDSALGSK